MMWKRFKPGTVYRSWPVVMTVCPYTLFAQIGQLLSAVCCINIETDISCPAHEPAPRTGLYTSNYRCPGCIWRPGLYAHSDIHKEHMWLLKHKHWWDSFYYSLYNPLTLISAGYLPLFRTGLTAIIQPGLGAITICTLFHFRHTSSFLIMVISDIFTQGTLLHVEDFNCMLPISGCT